jgi:hypothetical protein
MALAHRAGLPTQIMARLFAVLACLTVACGGNDSSKQATNPPAPKANPCATPGATYLNTYTTVSGDCGDIASDITNIGDDGTVPAAMGVTCKSYEQDGCRAHNTGCSTTQGKCTLTATTDVTFSDDGSTASGLFSAAIVCTDGSSCSGTYQIMSVRQ